MLKLIIAAAIITLIIVIEFIAAKIISEIIYKYVKND